jgi:hypothetical protein
MKYYVYYSWEESGDTGQELKIFSNAEEVQKFVQRELDDNGELGLDHFFIVKGIELKLKEVKYITKVMVEE